MPSPRRFGGTKTPRCEEYTISPPTEISPCRGLSRPAMERKVVVLPQPLGPRSVNSLPCGTSKATSCAADRKSTRLNSSHVSISYAVFCSKKKNKIEFCTTGRKNIKKQELKK